MDTRYIYSGSRAKTLEYRLLSTTQLDRLLSAKTSEEARKTLLDTYLAPHMTKHEGLTISEVLDYSIEEGKKLLESIAPEKELLDVLWLKYDFYNLRTIIKGKKAGLEISAIKEKCFGAGRYSPDKLLKNYEEGNIKYLHKLFGEVVVISNTATNIFEIDIAANFYYFKAIQEIASRHKDNVFIQKFVTLSIDLFNIKTALRMLELEKAQLPIKKRLCFIPGETFGEKDLDTEAQIIKSFSRLGGERFWLEAIDHFKETGDHSFLEKRSDEYLLTFLKGYSNDLFSIASLFSYFIAKKNNAQLIKTILTAKESGMSEKDLRITLRKLYI